MKGCEGCLEHKLIEFTTHGRSSIPALVCICITVLVCITLQAAAPAASRPTTFLEAACRAPIPAARSVTTAARDRQGRSAGRFSAAVCEGIAAESGMHSPQLLAARRPDTVAENGWCTVASKKGQQVCKACKWRWKQHAQQGLACSQWRWRCFVRTKAQNKHHAKLRRKAMPQTHSRVDSFHLALSLRRQV